MNRKSKSLSLYILVLNMRTNTSYQNQSQSLTNVLKPGTGSEPAAEAPSWWAGVMRPRGHVEAVGVVREQNQVVEVLSTQ